MKIYNYEKITGEYLGESLATQDPLDVSNYLIPAEATSQAPIFPKKGFAVCFRKDKWTLVVDNRQEIMFLNCERVFFELGDKITKEMTFNQFTFDEIKKNSEREITTIARDHQEKLIPHSRQTLFDYTTKAMLAKFALKNDETSIKVLKNEADTKDISVAELATIILGKHLDDFKSGQALNIEKKKALANIKIASTEKEMNRIIKEFKDLDIQND